MNVFTRVAWSLCYQEQFYFVCFLAVLVRGKSLFRTLALVSLGSLGIRVVAFDIGAETQIAGTFPLLWHQFAIGLAAYWYLNGDASSRVKAGIVTVLLAMVAVSIRCGDVATVASAIFGLGLISLRRWDEPWTRIALLDPLRSIGRRSYSIYLIHLPMVVVGAAALGELGVTSFWARAFFMVPLISVASTAVGLLFYRVVESQFLDLPRRFPAAKPIPCPIRADRPASARLSPSLSSSMRFPSIG